MKSFWKGAICPIVSCRVRRLQLPINLNLRTPKLNWLSYLDLSDHVLSDHFKYFVQGSPHVLLLQILRQRLKINGAVLSASIRSKVKQWYVCFYIVHVHLYIFCSSATKHKITNHKKITYLYPGTVAYARNISALSGRMWVVSLSSSSGKVWAWAALPSLNCTIQIYIQNYDTTSPQIIF